MCLCGLHRRAGHESPVQGGSEQRQRLMDGEGEGRTALQLLAWASATAGGSPRPAGRHAHACTHIHTHAHTAPTEHEALGTLFCTCFVLGTKEKWKEKG